MTKSDALLEHVIAQIESAPLLMTPFPHLVVEDLVPPSAYQEIVAQVPSSGELDEAVYPGTGFGRRGPRYRDFGYVHSGFSSSGGALGCLHDVFASDRFARTLLATFEKVIPPSKHRYFLDDADDFTSVFDLQIDLPGYAISPHRDVAEKIVTYQLYLSRDQSLAAQGTMLCSPKNRRARRGRGWPTRLAGRAVDRLLKPGSASHRRAERSRVGEAMGVGAQRSWLPWGWFTVDKTIPALPNHFLAFAPSDHSFHAVRMDDLGSERPVVRGFLRSGKNTTNWIGPRQSSP